MKDHISVDLSHEVVRSGLHGGHRWPRLTWYSSLVLWCINEATPPSGCVTAKEGKSLSSEFSVLFIAESSSFWTNWDWFLVTATPAARASTSSLFTRSSQIHFHGLKKRTLPGRKGYRKGRVKVMKDIYLSSIWYTHIVKFIMVIFKEFGLK